MAIKFTCPHCDQSHRVGDEWAGQFVLCPATGEKLLVPVVNRPDAVDVVTSSHHRVSDDISTIVIKRKVSRNYMWMGGIAVASCVMAVLIVTRFYIGAPSPPSDTSRESIVQSDEQLSRLSIQVAKDSVLVESLSRKTEWISTFTKLVSEDASNYAKFEGLTEHGFVVKMDHEAKKAVVDQYGWDVLSEFEGGRYLATLIISREMAHRRGLMDGTYVKASIVDDLRNGEVTVFSSETGRSLSWVDSRGECHIFR